MESRIFELQEENVNMIPAAKYKNMKALNEQLRTELERLNQEKVFI